MAYTNDKPTGKMSQKQMEEALGRRPTEDEKWPDGVMYKGHRWTFSLIWQKWVRYT